MEQENDMAAIAVIDDDRDVRDVLGALLEECGHPVKAYSSGQQFLADNGYDSLACLIVDQNMPHMSGLQLLAELDHRGVYVPSLLITGAHCRDLADAAIYSNTIAVLEKPLEPLHLLQFVALVAQ